MAQAPPGSVFPGGAMLSPQPTRDMKQISCRRPRPCRTDTPTQPCGIAVAAYYPEVAAGSVPLTSGYRPPPWGRGISATGCQVVDRAYFAAGGDRWRRRGLRDD